MHVRALLVDSRAAAPVVQFVLGVGVALAVVTAAVVALGGVAPALACQVVGDCQDPTATATLDGTGDPGTDGWGTGDETVTFVHRGGDRVVLDQVAFRVDGTRYDDAVAWPDGNAWTRGETATFTGTVPANQSVLVVWSDPSGDTHQILAAWQRD